MKNETDRTTQAPEDVLDELRSLVSEAEKLIGQTPEGSCNCEASVAALRERLEAAQERLADFYQGARKKVVAGAKYTDEAIREHPYQSIAIAVGVGLLAGVLLGRRFELNARMNDSDPAPSGFVRSLRTLGDGLLASVQERIELFSVELAEEKFRLIQTFVWISAAMFAGVMAVTFISLTLVYLFWDTARLAVLGAFAVVYSGGLIAILFAFRRYLARQPKPFATTLEEINEDRACIREES